MVGAALVVGVYEWYGIPRNTFFPKPQDGDYSWIEYLPHAHASRFRQPPTLLTPGNLDLAAAWNVFGVSNVNVNWKDPKKDQPTPKESYACYTRVRTEHERLGAIWTPPRAEDREIEETALLLDMKTVLGLSKVQLRVVENVLWYAYRDALFLCMTPDKKDKWLGIVEANKQPSPELFFPRDEESAALEEMETDESEHVSFEAVEPVRNASEDKPKSEKAKSTKPRPKKSEVMRFPQKEEEDSKSDWWESSLKWLRNKVYENLYT